MAPGSDRAGRSRAQEREAEKVRRQKIFIAVGGVVLLGVVGFQLTDALSSSPGSGSPAPAATPAAPAPAGGVAVPITHSASATSPIPRSVARLAPRDFFVPQASALGSGGTAVTASGVAAEGPAVRASRFVVKDVFAPQVTVPAASPATSSLVTSAGGAGASSAQATSGGGGGYIVVLTSIPGIGPASRKAAARVVVAAGNAGLQDVAANDAVPGESGASAHFTIYTGPYLTEATTRHELFNALHDGYPHAHAQLLPSSTGKGF